MKHRSFLIALLLLVFGILDVVTSPGYRGSSHEEVVIFPLLYSQTVLLGLWLGLGRTPWPFRLLGACAAICALAWVAGENSLSGYLQPRLTRSELIIGLSLRAILVGVPLFLARFTGLCLGDSTERVEPNDLPRPRFVFTLQPIFFWIAAVALALGFVRYRYVLPGDMHDIVNQYTAIGWQVVLAWAALWLALGEHRVGLRIATFGSIFLLIFLATYDRPAAYNLANFREILPLFSYAVLLLAPLAVVRSADYRLAWRPQCQSQIGDKVAHPQGSPVLFFAALLFLVLAGGRETVAFPLILSQVSLLALWVVLGKSHLAWKVVALGVAIGVLSILMGEEIPPYIDFLRPPPTKLDVVVQLSALAVKVMVAALIAALAGLHITSVDERARERNVAELRPFQFTLRSLFSLITVVAIVLGLLQLFKLPMEILDVLHGNRETLWQVVFACLGLWLILGQRRFRLRIAVFLGYAVIGLSSYSVFEVEFILWQALFVLVPLVAVRAAGYRLAWRGRMEL